jgi:GT2 family glycosyltransferase
VHTSTEQLNVYLIILNWNGKKDTLACLASLKNVSYKNLSLIVVDNGSNDDSVEAIKNEFPEVLILETGQNLGFAEGNNVGIRHALAHGAEAVCLLNNDTVVDPEFISAFVKAAATSSKIGILGAKIYLYESQRQMDHLGGMWNPRKASFDLVGNRAVDDGVSWETMKPIDYVCGAALFIKREVLESVGLLEPKFFLIWEESDLCFRARRFGFEVMTCPSSKIWHKVSASFVGGKPHSTYFWWRNRLLWIARNCTKKEKWKIYLTILFPEIFHLWKLYWIKLLELSVLKRYPKKPFLAKQEKLLKYKAALQGIQDYRKKRFGNGPAWIYKRPAS